MGIEFASGLDLHGVREWFSEKVTFEPRSARGQEANCQENWRKNVPGRGNSNRKSPEAGGQRGWRGERAERTGLKIQKKREVVGVALYRTWFCFQV